MNGEKGQNPLPEKGSIQPISAFCISKHCDRVGTISSFSVLPLTKLKR
jgi:hypothetical protein